MTARATASGSSSITDVAQNYIKNVFNTIYRLVSSKIINIWYFPASQTEIARYECPSKDRVTAIDIILIWISRNQIECLRLNIDDLWYRFALSFLLESIEFFKYSIWLWHKSCANMM